MSTVIEDISMKAIDLFAGAGGFTIGAEAAGARVVWAANHWQAAVDIHEANHPATAIINELRRVA